MAKRDMYNSSGCLDLTAYYAIRNVERERLRKRRRNQGRPLPADKRQEKSKEHKSK